MPDAAAEASSDPVPQVLTEPFAERFPEVADWLPGALLPFWAAVADYPILGALLIAIAFFVIAFAVQVTLFPILHRLTGLSRSSVDDQVLQDLRKPIFHTIFYLGLAMATRTANLPAGTTVIINIMLSVIVTSWIRAALRISNAVLDGLEKNDRFTLIETRTIPLFA